MTEKNNKVWYIIQKYINNKWRKFCREARYSDKEVAKDIYINLRNKYPNRKYRLIIIMNKKTIKVCYSKYLVGW